MSISQDHSNNNNNCNKWLTCQTAVQHITYPWTTLFAVYFSIIAFTSTFFNAVILTVLCRIIQHQSKSNYFKYLISLAASDLCVGIVVCTTTALAFASRTLQNNCLLDLIRRYVAVLSIGTTNAMIGIISFDRYLLLTRPHHFHTHISQRHQNAVITMAWCTTGLAPLLRFVNRKVYQTVCALVVLTIFLFLAVCYYYLTKAVRISERNIKEAMKENFPNTKKNKMGVGIKFWKNNYQHRKYIQSVQAVLLLITAYILFVGPIAVHAIISISLENVLTEKCSHMIYAVMLAIIVINSLVNPFIYFAKIKDLRQELRKIFIKVFRSFLAQRHTS